MATVAKATPATIAAAKFEEYILSGEEQERLAQAKKYAMQESVKHVLLKQQSQSNQVMESTASVGAMPGMPFMGIGLSGENMFLQKQQALVLMCRVYVGSIYYDLKEEIIRNAFSPFGPFKSLNMSFDPVTGKHKGFAFIEYECPEAAQLSLEQMGGVMLGGRSIKVGRPANMPQSHPVIDLLIDESKLSKRIYVSSVHCDLNTEDLKSVFSAFGNILSCTLVADPLTGKHKGYGFVEFDALQSANDAVSSMNLFDLGGQYLRVGKAIAPAGLIIPAGSSFNNNPSGASGISTNVINIGLPPAVLKTRMANVAPTSGIPPPGIATPTLGGGSIPPPGIAQLPASLSSKAKENMELPNTLSAQEELKLSGVEARHMVMQKLMRKDESKVMILRNMVDLQDIDELLESEVTEECGKFGPVDRVIIYQEKQSEEDDADVLVKIFVQFKEVQYCVKAADMMNGRWFGGRKIQADIFPQEKFNHNDLSG